MSELESITITAADGFALAADLGVPPSPRGAVLIAPAMGVPRSFYRAFALFLAESGLAVLTLDYRGIGGSAPPKLRGFQATLHDWAELDLEAALAFLDGRFPTLPITWVGHSVGGQLFGLMKEPRVRAALFVASQSGYHRNWTGAARLGMTALWYAAIPVFTAVTGSLPMSLAGQGENIPAGVAREWASWGKKPDYIHSYAKLHPGRAFDTFSGPIRSYAIGDDNYAPPRSVEALLEFYAHAKTELRRLEPSALAVREIKHFGIFKRRFRDTFWPEARDYLLNQPAGRASTIS
jgi:predicted alpha/beta hydrolase